MDKCVKIVSEKTKGALSEKQIKELIYAVGKKKEINGAAETISEIDISAKRRSFIAKQQKLAVLKNKEKLNDLVNAYQNGKSVRDIFRDVESTYLVKNGDYQRVFDNAMKEAGFTMRDYLSPDPKIESDFILELANISNGGSKSVTGNEKLYRLASKIREMQLDAHSAKVSNGIAVGKTDNYISRQSWQSNKLALRSKEEFYADMKDVIAASTEKVDGVFTTTESIRDRAYWDNVYDSLVSGNHTDFAEELKFADTKDVTPSSMSFAERLSASRKIKLTPEQYIAIGNKYFARDNIFQRLSQDLATEARTQATLTVFGPKGQDQLDDFVTAVNSLNKDKATLNAAGTVDTELSMKKLKKYKAEYFGTAESDKGNAVAAKASSLIRKTTMLDYLGSSIFSAMSDVVVHGTRVAQLLGDNNLAYQIGEELSRAMKTMGSPEELKSFTVGIANTFEAELIPQYRMFEDAAAFSDSQFKSGKVSPGTRTVGSFLDNSNKVIDGAFKWNPINAWTEFNQSVAYTTIRSALHKVKDKSFNDLEFDLKRSMKINRITPDEWDFFRANAEDTILGNENILDPDVLKEVDESKLEELFKTVKNLDGELALSSTTVQQYRNELVTKFRAMLFRETNTMVLVPDIVDRALITGGTGSGTLEGEGRRFFSQFKSFSIALMNRVMAPMRDKIAREGIASSAALPAQYATYMLGIACIFQWARDVSQGKTPRDMTKIENVVPLVTTALGVPIVDTLTNMAFSDNFLAAQVYETFAGPNASKAVKTSTRAYNSIKDVIEGDKNILEAGGSFVSQTFFGGSAPSTAGIVLGNIPMTKAVAPAVAGAMTLPGVSSFYRNVIYNNLVEMFSPGYKEGLEERMSERGQEYLFQ